MKRFFGTCNECIENHKNLVYSISSAFREFPSPLDFILDWV